ncbi:MAG TPA: nitronate monooxygenase [Nitrolancea sp.]|nr:nitronate monooxygenase [Nitrolancea sp.]
MALRTKLCDLLGIEVPIIQAPIGSGSGAQLAAAVSNAGGLGMLSVTWRSIDELHALLDETQKLTQRPFGINLVLNWNPAERLEICLAEGVKIVSFFWGDPTPYVDRVHRSGALVMQTVGSAEDARTAVAAGVDVVVAQGWEAGGHVWGQVGSMVLIPAVVDAVGDVPVVAAGGIADGRGIAAALTLGASGVWLGTRFLASQEAMVHPLHKEMVVAHAETDTVYGEPFNIGWDNAPHRALRNSTVKRWEAAGSPMTNRPGADETVAAYANGTPIVRYGDIMPDPAMTGDLEALAFYAGQSTGLIHSIEPAAQIVAALVAEAEAVLSGGARMTEK